MASVVFLVRVPILPAGAASLLRMAAIGVQRSPRCGAAEWLGIASTSAGTSGLFSPAAARTIRCWSIFRKLLPGIGICCANFFWRPLAGRSISGPWAPTSSRSVPMIVCFATICCCIRWWKSCMCRLRRKGFPALRNAGSNADFANEFCHEEIYSVLFAGFRQSVGPCFNCGTRGPFGRPYGA